MEGLEPLDNDRELPDVFVRGQPMRITQARAYFRLKGLQAWGAEVELHPWDTWDRLADRLGTRLGRHIWHLSHWDGYYEALPGCPRVDAWGSATNAGHGESAAAGNGGSPGVTVG